LRTLSSFQNIHAADRIVVCGCGSSLNDFHQPERFVTIGVNDVGRLFQPKYLLVVDPKDRFKNDRFHYVETSQAEYLFTQIADLGVLHPNIVKFRLGEKNGTSFSDPNVLHYSVVTPYMALYLAALMGSKCIGIIGVDFTDHHFFAKTGTHEWTPYLASIDQDFHRLGKALVARGIKVFNLSSESRLTAFPKMSLAEFAEQPILSTTSASSPPLRIVSYATTPVAGVPAILTRCINARTPHHSRCLWAGGDYGNGVVYQGDLNWNHSPAAATAELEAADVVIVHNGKVDPQHQPLLTAKPVLTMAHNYMWNVDQSFVHQGFPGVVLGQYQSTLPDFKGWSTVPNPVPLWEPAFRPGDKENVVTICYTPSGKHDLYPKDHRLYWHSKGYDTTMRILESLQSRFSLRLEVVRDSQVSHAESLAMKRRSHILIDECVTGSYHRNSLEGLATGCVVVNGVGLLPGVLQALRQIAQEEDFNPFTFASLETLEHTLTTLIELGSEELVKLGAANRRWIEQHWDFASQWERFWRPAVSTALEKTKLAAKSTAPTLPQRVSSNLSSPSISVVIATLNEGEYLRRTVENLLATLPDDGEIIVVDDGSTDGSADFLKGRNGRLVPLHPVQRLGSACARNFGAAHARGEVLVFADAHVAAPPNWAPPLLAALRRPEVGAVMPTVRVMRFPDDYTSPGPSKEARGYGLRCRDAALTTDWLGRKASTPYPVPLLGAGFMAMRRNVFAATGGFDPNIVTWGTEDAEFSFRLWTLGFECLVVPEVDVAHRFRSERPYLVEWEAVLYNKMRLASIHFSPERTNRVAEQLKRNPAFPGALSRLSTADIEARRAHLHSLRRYDDNWFFDKFRQELCSELAAVAANNSSSAA